MNACDIIKNIIFFQYKNVSVDYCNNHINKHNIENMKEQITMFSGFSEANYIIIKIAEEYIYIHFNHTGNNSDDDNNYLFDNKTYDNNLNMYIRLRGKDYNLFSKVIRVLLKDFNLDNLKKAISFKDYHDEKFKNKLKELKKDMFITFVQ